MWGEGAWVVLPQVPFSLAELRGPMASPTSVEQGQAFPEITAGSQLLVTGNGCLQRVAVSSSSSGTLTAYDNTSATGAKLLNGFPLTAGNVYTFNLVFNTGLYITVGGTAEITITKGP